MRILITTPSMNLHGGIRVIVEWANHLARRDHEVTLQVLQGRRIPNDWIDIDPQVNVVWRPLGNASDADVIVATTPPIAALVARMRAKGRKFYLLQMLEDMFQPKSPGWVNTCKQSYQVDFPILSISKWNETLLREKHGRTAPIIHIGNGVSEHFRPGQKDEQLTVLVEGWNGYNAAKDTEHIGPRAAEYMKQKYGARIIAYAQQGPRVLPGVPDEFWKSPGTDEIVRLYQRAHFMIKATKYDARSCAPVEAMKCGTPTARAIILGDDDLYHGYNCLRCGYDYEALTILCDKLTRYDDLRNRLALNGLQYAQKWLDWNFWMDIVESIFHDT